jgi:hypothetical protein
VSTLALVVPENEPRSWESVLAGAIRPEFAVERYVPRPGSVLFGKRECAVAGCMLPTHRSLLFCGGHDRQWRRRGSGSAADGWVVLEPEAGGATEMRGSGSGGQVRGRGLSPVSAVGRFPRAVCRPLRALACMSRHERAAWGVHRDSVDGPAGAGVASRCLSRRRL